ncbi:MAG: PAS domain S-box protein [Deltaproteobacteria bacterium]|nr:PAS domain S-box protein [Deltaproteobacteria bacterium]
MSRHPIENMDLELLKGAVENTNEAFVTIDKNHKVLFFNKAAEKIFGYSRDEVLGHDLDVIMAPGCSRDHRIAVERYIETRTPTRIGHATEIMATRKNGERFPADISFSVSEVNGELFFTGIIRDLTEAKALEEQIKRSERLAAICQVVPEITHEIKNPLMMIGGFARQLIRQAKDEKSRKKLSVIADEVQRLESLLQDLKEFYMPRRLTYEEMDINLLLKEVYSLVKHDAEKKDIRIEFKTGKEPLIIKGDRDRLKQVFLNLEKNSIEAMENGGNLSIRAQLNNGMAETTIADDGCGISEADQKEIFTPFFTTKSHGTGLGLSISRSIIEEHKGSTFNFESKEGEGTVFKITMPTS